MSKFSRIIFFTLALVLAWSFLNPKTEDQVTDDVVLEIKSDVPIGKEVIVTVKNNSEEDLELVFDCTMPPLLVERYMNGEWMLLEGEAEANCSEEVLIVQAGGFQKVNLTRWNLFDQKGRYKISLEKVEEDSTKTYAKEITITSPGFFRTLWWGVFYKPIFNTLIFFISILPGHNLGWAIILLTLLIKLILLAPNQKALKAQKAMQKVQPQLDALKKKYKDNPQKLAQETMAIWQKHKVSPMSSCLPMLIQFPVLIALFYVVKDGLDFINPLLLYSGLEGFEASSIEPVFLGLIDLTQVNILVLPIVIGLLQFAQMKLTLGKSLKNASKNSPMPMMNKTMMYIMPLIIAFFTASLPAAVGFYWGTSTLFGIGQQMVVNRSKD